MKSITSGELVFHIQIMLTYFSVTEWCVPNFFELRLYNLSTGQQIKSSIHVKF